MIGIQYVTWFGLEGVNSGCQGSGWVHKPFNLDNVRSLAFSADPNGVCYSSWDPATALGHASLLDELNIDFVVTDRDTNFSKGMVAANNPIHQCALKSMEGFRLYGRRKIRTVMMLSITGWDANQIERFTFNEYVQSHIDSVATQALLYPDDFVRIDGKPVILFYISQGSNVYSANDTLAFHGPGNITPTAADFDCFINVPGAPKLRDFFAVRYAVHAASNFDYSNYSPHVWPFQCDHGHSTFTEAAYASLLLHGVSPHRSTSLFNELVDAGRHKPFLIIRVWNEFSSTDEHGGSAYTIEPNTQLHKVDTTPGNQDPWFFFNQIKSRLSRGVLLNRESGKAVDVEMARIGEDGAMVQQWQQIAGGLNQQWVKVARSFKNIRSEKVLDADRPHIGENGARVQQWADNGTPNQQWSFEAADGEWVWLRNLESGKALDVPRDRIGADGTPLQQWDYGGTPNQQWKLVVQPL